MADDVVETFHITAGSDAFATTFYAAAFPAFWNTAHGGADPLASFLSQSLSGAVTGKIYKLDDPEPRAPIATFSHTLALPGTNLSGLPEEIALVLSYQADAASGQVQARRRGRLYFGPLAVTAIAGAGAGDTTWTCPPRPATVLINSMNQAAKFLADLAGPNSSWVVYSRKLASLGLTATHVVTNGWVDNEFDGQSRRRVAATARTTWAA